MLYMLFQTFTYSLCRCRRRREQKPHISTSRIHRNYISLLCTNVSKLTLKLTQTADKYFPHVVVVDLSASEYIYIYVYNYYINIWLQRPAASSTSLVKSDKRQVYYIYIYIHIYRALVCASDGVGSSMCWMARPLGANELFFTIYCRGDWWLCLNCCYLAVAGNAYVWADFFGLITISILWLIWVIK